MCTRGNNERQETAEEKTAKDGKKDNTERQTSLHPNRQKPRQSQKDGQTKSKRVEDVLDSYSSWALYQSVM